MPNVTYDRDVRTHVRIPRKPSTSEQSAQLATITNQTYRLLRKRLGRREAKQFRDNVVRFGRTAIYEEHRKHLEFMINAYAQRVVDDLVRIVQDA